MPLAWCIPISVGSPKNELSRLAVGSESPRMPLKESKPRPPVCIGPNWPARKPPDCKPALLKPPKPPAPRKPSPANPPAPRMPSPPNSPPMPLLLNPPA